MDVSSDYGIYIPKSINDIIYGLDYKIDKVGLSDSTVFIFDDYILKISNISYDVLNEIKVSDVLKNKLLIPNILVSVIENDKAYILKTKIKGKMLCDKYYMERPNLLFKLASDALKMLWDIDINDLNLDNTTDTILNYGIDKKDSLDINESDRNITGCFNSYNEIIDYIIKNKPEEDNVLTHGDFCISNIICQDDRVVGFIDLGLMGISNRYHDISILYRSIKYNFMGKYGRSYDGFDEDMLFKLLNIKKDDNLIKYYLLLDELLA